MKLRIFTLALILNIFVFNVYSQNTRGKISITGQVKDKLNRPVANAALFVDGTKLKIKTNSQGYYKLKLKKRPRKIMVLSVIYGIHEVDFNGSKVFNITYGKESLNVTDKNPSMTYKTKTKKISHTQPTFTNIYYYLRAKSLYKVYFLIRQLLLVKYPKIFPGISDSFCS